MIRPVAEIPFAVLAVKVTEAATLRCSAGQPLSLPHAISDPMGHHILAVHGSVTMPQM